jgi:hypothetical protein
MTTSDFPAELALGFVAAPYVVCVAGALVLTVFGALEHALNNAMQTRAK